MDKVKDQIRILERMLANMEIRSFDEKETADLLRILTDLLKMMNDGVYEWFVEQEKKKEK